MVERCMCVNCERAEREKVGFIRGAYAQLRRQMGVAPNFVIAPLTDFEVLLILHEQFVGAPIDLTDIRHAVPYITRALSDAPAA
jgi:hypothetical protein